MIYRHRILQVGIFQDHALGGCKVFYEGFLMNGYSVVPFDFRSVAADIGKAGMNEKLVKQSSEYDLVFIGKGEIIEPNTLKRMKERGTHIALWYGDIREDVPEWLKNLLPYVDTFFMSTGGKLLNKYHQYGNKLVSAFYFNPSIPSIVEKQNQITSKKYNVLYTGSFYPFNDGLRGITVKELLKRDDAFFFGGIEKLADPKIKRFFKNKLRLYSKRIRGNEYIDAIKKTKIGIGVNAYNKYDKYTSDRLTHFMEFGCFYLSYKFPKIETLFEVGIDLQVFSTMEEFNNKVEFYLNNADARENIAKQGQKRLLEDYNTRNMTKYMMSIIKRNYQIRQSWQEVLT